MIEEIKIVYVLYVRWKNVLVVNEMNEFKLARNVIILLR